MKFICQQQNLIKILNIVSKAVSVRTTMPVLKGILLKAENGRLTMSASDLDLSIEDSTGRDKRTGISHRNGETFFRYRKEASG